MDQVGCDVQDLRAGASADWLQKAADLARRILAAPIAIVASDLERQPLRALSGSGNAESLGAIAASCHATIATGRPCVMPDRSAEQPHGSIASLIAVPVRLSCRQDVSMLCVMDRIPRAWSDEDLSNLTDLAGILTIQSEHAEAAYGAEIRFLAAAAQAATDGLAADLRAPLEVITRFTQFLETERRPDLVAIHARSIRAAVDSVLGIVDQIPIAGARPADLNEAAAPRLDDEPPRLAPPQPAPIRILLADDLDLNRKLIADMLTIEGHVVDCVADGAAAVNAASQRPYDLILMDMIMPGMDGIAATRAIRALPGPASKVPIVALTANSFQEQLDSCLTAGMDATLTKPMSIEQLTSTVRAWARGAEHRSEQRQDTRGRNEAA